MLKILWLLLLYSIPSPAWRYQALSSRQASVCAGHAFGAFVAHPEDCKLFYLCGENAEAVLATCPPNMLFNPQTMLCDNASNVPCESRATTAKPAVISSSSSSSADNNMSPPRIESYCFNYYAKQSNSYALVFMPHPHNCQQYYMCYQGEALLQACSPKLHWNANLNKCDLPSQSNCLPAQLEVETEEEEGQREEEAVEIVPSLGQPIWGNGLKCPLHGEHIFPNIKRCDAFIYCVKGQAVLQACPFYHYFDVDSGRCNWRTKSTCVKDLTVKYRSMNF